MEISNLLSIFTVLMTSLQMGARAAVTMTTTHGSVRGTEVTTSDNGRLEVFYGVPFAKPPVGDLRFQVRTTLIWRKLRILEELLKSKAFSLNYHSNTTSVIMCILLI